LCFPQNTESRLSLKFKQADSVLLISHGDTKGYGFVDSLGNSLPQPQLLVGNKPNYKIIKERKLINGQELSKLIEILTRSSKSNITTVITNGCFTPHHTIFLFKNGKTSYIDLCFMCRGFETSKDLKNLSEFESSKWAELELFFRKAGFKYKLD